MIYEGLSGQVTTVSPLIEWKEGRWRREWVTSRRTTMPTRTEAEPEFEMPWNRRRVEQWIGRMDRLMQDHSIIRIVNRRYEDTVETDVHLAARECIDLYVIGVRQLLQPILPWLPGAMGDKVALVAPSGRRTWNSGQLDILTLLLPMYLVGTS